MILMSDEISLIASSKPRASGDDPAGTKAESATLK